MKPVSYLQQDNNGKHSTRNVALAKTLDMKTGHGYGINISLIWSDGKLLE